MTASGYRAPWWLPGGHAQTIWPAIALGRSRPALVSEQWTTPDGDVIRVDRLDAPVQAPLVVLWHGLEGDATSHYVGALAVELAATGWRMLVPHWRGCGGVESSKPRAYHSGDSTELDWMLARAQAIAAGAPLFGAGVSLGGNVLLKWLGEQGAAAASDER